MVRSPGQLGKSIYTQPLNILSSPQAFYLCIQIISLNWIQPSLSCCQAVTMVGRNSLSGSIWIAVTLTLFAINVYLQGAEGATFVVTNQCPYTVWAAASPGGGQALEQGQTWTFDVAAGTPKARIWGRTGCSFDANGQGKCNTGDCGGLLNCQGYGSPPQTLFEYALNQYMNLDFYDMSLIEGFNIPLTATPSNCQKIGCTNDIIAACPAELKVTGGCNGPCAQLNTPQYCCTGNYADNNCVPNNYSEFFKGQCPQAYSYPKDDATSTFTCPSGANYNVVFCG